MCVCVCVAHSGDLSMLSVAIVRIVRTITISSVCMFTVTHTHMRTLAH